LNLVAVRDIDAGEELTLDYTTFATPEMASFECSCRSSNCRGFISFEPDVVQNQK
jgi:D-alanine-D-alanine ligase